MYEFIKLNNKKEFDMKYVIDNINNNVIKEHFYQLYIENKLSNNKKIRMTNLTSNKELNILYEYFYNPVPMEEMDIRVRLNNVYRKDDEISDCTEYFYDSYFSGEKESDCESCSDSPNNRELRNGISPSQCDCKDGFYDDNNNN